MLLSAHLFRACGQHTRGIKSLENLLFFFFFGGGGGGGGEDGEGKNK